MSNQELEIKFTLDASAGALWDSTLKKAFSDAGFFIEEKVSQTLTNTYFDTKQQLFETLKMGMRVRGCDDNYEQTLKTQKSVNAGIHERNEFNIPLTGDKPDLSLFPTEAWPQELDENPNSLELQAQFTTHFIRKKAILSNEIGVCELVFDDGEVTTSKNATSLHEIEVELVEGSVAVLLKAASVLSNYSVRLSDVSKAAQGYALLNGQSTNIKKLPTALTLDEDETTENVFCLSAQKALAHWQHHEHLFFETGSTKFLPEIADGIRLLLQSLALFLPVIQCEPMLKLQRETLAFSEKWLWVDELKSMRFLSSRKGPFYKTLSKQTAVTSYLQGRRQGLLNAHDPKLLLTSKEANDIKLSALSLLNEKPWRLNTSLFDMPVIEHAKGWLSQGWQTLHQATLSNRPLRPVNYTTVESLMRQTLFNGFILSGLFPESGPARAPWLDLLMGIDEIRALLLLKQSLREAEIEYEAGLEVWVDEKLNHLLRVMERTRQVAMSKHTYW